MLIVALPFRAGQVLHILALTWTLWVKRVARVVWTLSGCLRRLIHHYFRTLWGRLLDSLGKPLTA